MARGRSARRGARGGESIQALRAKRALTAAGAFVALAGVCAYPVLAAERVQWPLAWAAGGALLVLAVGLAGRWGPLLQLALTVAVGTYAGYLVDVGDFDRWAPLVAAGLVLTGELAYTSIEPPARRAWPFGVAMVASAALLGALLLGAAGAGAGRVLELAIGVAAATAAFALIARIAVAARR